MGERKKLWMSREVNKACFGISGGQAGGLVVNDLKISIFFFFEKKNEIEQGNESETKSGWKEGVL